MNIHERFYIPNVTESYLDWYKLSDTLAISKTLLHTFISNDKYIFQLNQFIFLHRFLFSVELQSRQHGLSFAFLISMKYWFMNIQKQKKKLFFISFQTYGSHITFCMIFTIISFSFGCKRIKKLLKKMLATVWVLHKVNLHANKIQNNLLLFSRQLFGHLQQQ